MSVYLEKLKDIVVELPCSYGDDLGKYGYELPVVKVSNVDAVGRLYGEFEKRSFKEREIDKLLVQQDELLVVKSSGSKANVLSGKTAICQNGNAGRIVASNFLLRLKPDKAKVNPKFLWYFLNSNYAKKFVKSIVGATTYPNLKWEQYSELEVPLPKVYVQDKLVAILDKADEVRQKDQQLLRKYDELLRCIYFDFFEKDDLGLHEVELGDLIAKKKNSARTGPFGSDLLHSEFTDSGVCVLGIDNAVKNEFKWGKERFISFGKYEKLKRYTVFPNDVLVTIMGTVGRSAVVPESIPLSINSKHLAAITFDLTKVNPFFISYYIHSGSYASRQIKLKNRGAIMDGLNLGVIKELKVKLPPIELQNRFGSVYKNIVKQKEIAHQEVRKSNDLFECLLQKAFKGELVT